MCWPGPRHAGRHQHHARRHGRRAGDQHHLAAVLEFAVPVAPVSATADPIDNSVRNFRVVARRALTMTQSGETLRPEIIEIVDDLSGAYEVLRAMMVAPPGGQPDEADAARVLRTIARKARTDLVSDSSMSETAILAQLRSLIVDLLMVAGLQRSSARATLRD